MSSAAHSDFLRDKARRRAFWPRLQRTTLIFGVMALALCLEACHSQPKQPKMAMGWRNVASWSGRGSTRTEEFETGTGQFRIKWSTSNEDVPGKGYLKVVLHSSVSGRWVSDAVDEKGIGSGVSYQAEEPRQFFLDIDSAGLDWKISVDEGEMGEVE